MHDEFSLEKLRSVIEDSHLNFLVGAGSSAELFDVLGDIENALALLAEKEPTDDIKIARASIYAKFFDGVIEKNKQLLDNPESAEPLLATYRSFLKSINRILLRRRSSLLNKQVNIFTTNVDLAFEVALDQLALDLNDGFAGKFLPRFDTGNFGSLRQRRSLQYENLSEVPTFNLLKLHGSVGWVPEAASKADGQLGDIHFDSSLKQIDITKAAKEEAEQGLVSIAADEKIVLVDGKIQTVIKTEDDETTVVNEDVIQAVSAVDKKISVQGFMNEYEKLAVVNPTKEKFQTTVLNENYYDLFRIFSNELEKENSVLFVIGFSFRDEHIRKLVIRAARANPTLQIYVFCYKSSTVDDMKSLIKEAAIKNGNVVFIAPDPVDEGEKEISLTLETITKKYFEPIVPEPRKTPDHSVEVVVNMKEDANDVPKSEL